eukprot:4001087-Amphidinium_carterae.1
MASKKGCNRWKKKHGWQTPLIPFVDSQKQGTFLQSVCGSAGQVLFGRKVAACYAGLRECNYKVQVSLAQQTRPMPLQALLMNGRSDESHDCV